MMASETEAQMLVAVATTCEGRHIFVGVDTCHFTHVSHFPASISEARELVAACSGRRLTRDQLFTSYAGAVVVVPLRETRPAARATVH